MYNSVEGSAVVLYSITLDATHVSKLSKRFCNRKLKINNFNSHFLRVCLITNDEIYVHCLTSYVCYRDNLDTQKTGHFLYFLKV